ncbi:MAG: Stp1/IreP family PP2C-type Ser/Thr phosphatase [Polyangiaceae bacterium]
MRAIAAGQTDIGRERNHNEDRFILLPEFNVFVVADGMGGHQSGEVASRMAATTIAAYFRAKETERPADIGERLKAAVCDANARIFARADDSRSHRGMGTTVVAAAFHGATRKMHVAHAGDSRAYHVRGGKMRQLTRDHSLLSDALQERPELTESDLAYLPRNVITRALGIAPTVEVDYTTVDSEVGDLFLLCSDGLHGLVEDDVLKTIMEETHSLTDACAHLVEAANRNGGKDNITAVLIRIEEEDEPWSRRSPGATNGAGPAVRAVASTADANADVVEPTAKTGQDDASS